MRILHLLSNWKWTERSEPAADLAAAQRAQGLEVTFACGQPPADAPQHVAKEAGQKGLDCVTLRAMRKHFNVFTLLSDRAELKALLDRLAPDVVHCHMPNAHWMAGLARGDAVRPALVRSFYDPEGPADDWRTRWLLRHRTDGAVVITGRAAAALAERQGPGEGRVLVSEPSVDVTRFSPDRPVAGGRADFGLAPEHFVVGVVSRIRDSRRLDIPLGAVARLSGRFPHLRLLIVGRGGEGAVREVVERPAERLGIRDKVVLAGYCQGDRLVAAYRAMDVLAYPMPGTDKSCRTVREAMAAGVAVVASRIGFLKQLVSDGHNGLLTDLSVERMAESVDALAGDREVLGAMRRGALETARDRFAPDRQAARIAVLYENVLANPKR